MSEPVVRVERLHHSFGDGPTARRVLEAIDLSVAPEEFLLVTGPSGSGKTTLLTILGTLRRATGGRVEILGVPLAQARRAEIDAVRRRIGFVFQRHSLLRPLTVAENVEAALHAVAAERRDIRQRAVTMLAAVGLGGRADDMPDRLSGGEQQRVAVARALVRRPALVIADEPTASLDRAAGRLVVATMKRLAAEAGSAVVMTSHDERLFDIADRRIHLEDGRLAAVPPRPGRPHPEAPA